MRRNSTFAFLKLEGKCSKKAQIIWDRQYLAFCPLKIIVNIVTIEFIQKSVVAVKYDCLWSKRSPACCEKNLISCRATSQAVVSFLARFCSFSDISMFSLSRFLFIEFHFQILQIETLGLREVMKLLCYWPWKVLVFWICWKELQPFLLKWFTCSPKSSKIAIRLWWRWRFQLCLKGTLRFAVAVLYLLVCYTVREILFPSVQG